MNPAKSRHESSHSPSGTTSQFQLLDAPSRFESLESIAPAASHRVFPLSATPSGKSLHTVHREQDASRSPPKKPAHSHKMSSHQLSKKIKLRASVKKRAESRTKVPERIRDSFQPFFYSTTGMLKVLRMVSRSRLVAWVGGGREGGGLRS